MGNNRDEGCSEWGQKESLKFPIFSFFLCFGRSQVGCLENIVCQFELAPSESILWVILPSIPPAPQPIPTQYCIGRSRLLRQSTFSSYFASHPLTSLTPIILTKFSITHFCQWYSRQIGYSSSVLFHFNSVSIYSFNCKQTVIDLIWCGGYVLSISSIHMSISLSSFRTPNLVYKLTSIQHLSICKFDYQKKVFKFS